MNTMSKCMRNRLLSFAAVCSMLAVAVHADDEQDMGKKAKDLEAKAKVGEAAPAFKLMDTKGKEHALADFKGKLVVLEWTNYDCPFVKKHYMSKNMQKLQAEYTAKGVVWLSICSSAEGKQGYNEPTKWNELIEKHGAKSSAVLLDVDGKVGHRYGAKTTPHMFVIDKEGVLRYAGAIDDIRSADPDDAAKAKNYVKAALDELMEGKEVTTKNSKPYGCSVKYASK